MDHLKRIVGMVIAGAVLGAVFLGAGGRGAMRLLALQIGNQGVFSLGGSAEVVLYGAIVGAVGGTATAFVAPLLRGRTLFGGLLLGLALFGGTVATLPPHIAETAAPFADILPLVWLLFGLCFLAWGLAMSRIAAVIRSITRGGTPVVEARHPPGNVVILVGSQAVEAPAAAPAPPVQLSQPPAG